LNHELDRSTLDAARLVDVVGRDLNGRQHLRTEGGQRAREWVGDADGVGIAAWPRIGGWRRGAGRRGRRRAAGGDQCAHPDQAELPKDVASCDRCGHRDHPRPRSVSKARPWSISWSVVPKIIEHALTVDDHGVAGYIAYPERQQPGPALLLVHQYTGVVGYLKIEARKFAKLGYT